MPERLTNTGSQQEESPEEIAYRQAEYLVGGWYQDDAHDGRDRTQEEFDAEVRRVAAQLLAEQSEL